MGNVLRRNATRPIQWRIVVPVVLVVGALVAGGSLCVGSVVDVELLGWLLRMEMIALGVGIVAFVAFGARFPTETMPTRDDASSKRKIESLEAKLADRTRMVEEAYLDMRSLDRVKETFLSNLSHEMRTPLTSIMAAEEILSSYADEAPETREEFLNIIRQESTRLLALIGKLLDLAKLQAKALRLHYECVDICQLAEETVGAIRSQRPDLATTVKIARPGRAVACECDRERIARVLHSMLENALRYSPDGGTVRVTVSRISERVCVAVEDAGEHTDERFTDMFEGECVDRRSSAGSPFLGHPIAERLARMHGGTLTPEPSPTGGTVVTLFLPLEQAKPVPEPAQKAVAAAAAAKS